MARIVLNADAIHRAARAPGAAAFPFLAKYARKNAPGCCGSPSAAPDPRSAIDAVSRLPPARLAAFKKLLGADGFTVWVVRAARMTKLDL